MLFTWHGDSNLFQASFEVTAADMQPGARWTSELFMDSMFVDSLSGATYHGGDSSSGGTGGVYSDDSGWFLTFQLNDFGRQVEVLVSDISIREKPFSGPDIFRARILDLPSSPRTLGRRPYCVRGNDIRLEKISHHSKSGAATQSRRTLIAAIKEL